MKTTRFALALSVANVVGMFAFWSQMSMARAQIIVQPNDGSVLFRLIDQQRKPLVKLGAGADGSGLMLTGDPARQD